MINFENKKIGYLLIILAMILFVGVIYFVFYFDFGKFGQKTEITEEGTEVPAENIISVEPTEEKPPVVLSRQQMTLAPEQLAISFIERFGTFSNQAIQNLEELNLFMTTEMKDWATKNPPSIEDYDNYYGMTTIAVSAEQQELTSDFAKVLVHTSRRERNVDKEKVFNQDALVEMSKEGSRWKVSGVYWK